MQIDVLADLVDVNGCGIADRRCFEEHLASRGITEDSTIVIYSTHQNQYAAYLFWLFKYYRHTDVRLLDGGKRRWEETGRPTTTDEPSVSQQTYEAPTPNEQIRAYRTDIEAALARNMTIVDVRSEPEYEGDRTKPPNKVLPEARVAGHIPGTVHITWSEVIDENGRFKDRSELERLFHRHGVELDVETIVYCHVGERSSIVWFVLSELLGHDAVSNYDGSWIEWGTSSTSPSKRRSASNRRSGFPPLITLGVSSLELPHCDVIAASHTRCPQYFHQRVGRRPSAGIISPTYRLRCYNTLI